MCSLEKITPASQDNSEQLESPLQVPEKQSAFHPRAQRNAFRRRDARLQSRSFQLPTRYQTVFLCPFVWDL